MNTPAAFQQALGTYAWEVSPELVGRLADALMKLDDLSPEALPGLAALANDPAVRHETLKLLQHWRQRGGGSPRQLAELLQGAAAAVEAHARNESAQLVWTGPASSQIPFRRTDEALLEVIRGASRVLTLVTFAAYRVPDVCQALSAAIDRGVELRFVGETIPSAAGQHGFDAASALGPALSQRARLFEWPEELRARGERGLVGRLHAKCALADDRILLISSANLTEAALDANIEMGVLLEGGSLPRLAARHFEEMIRSGTLRPVLP